MFSPFAQHELVSEVGSEGGYCFFAALHSRAEDGDEEQKSAQALDCLCSYS